MKKTLFCLYIVLSIGLSAQTLNMFEGEYYSDGGQHLSIYSDSTFKITNNGLCAGATADGSYSIDGDTLFLTTRHHHDDGIPNNSNPTSPYYVYLDPILAAPPDSVGFLFHDEYYQYIREIFVDDGDSENYEIYHLDSTQMITIPIKKAQKIQKVFYESTKNFPVLFQSFILLPTRVYHVATTSPCYPSMTEEKLYMSEGNLYRYVGNFNGEPLLCVYKREEITPNR